MRAYQKYNSETKPDAGQALQEHFLNFNMLYALFENFDISTRIEIAQKKGVLIGERADDLEYIQLLRVYDFYVELAFYVEDHSDLFWIKSSNKDDLLGPYLDKIDLSALDNFT